MAAMQTDPRFANQLRTDEPMARHTSWRAGGSADIWFRPATRADLIDFMRTLDPAAEIHWVGLGSNLLVRDGGLRGVVINVQDALGEIEDLGGGRVQAGAGVACTILARHCVRHGLGPAEFFAGIPGTVGGALAMNAGAFGGETWQQVESVEVVDRQGATAVRVPSEYRIAYRQVDAPAKEWFLGGRVQVRRRLSDRHGKDPRTDKRAPRPAATRLAELRFGVPQSARRPCGPADRSGRPQGLCDRRRGCLGQACQFHHQCERCDCCRYRER